MTRPEDHRLLVEINLHAPGRRIDAAKIRLPQRQAVALFRKLKGDLEHIRLAEIASYNNTVYNKGARGEEKP